MDQVNLQGHGQQKMRQQPQQAAPRKYDGQQGNPLYDPTNGGHYGTSSRPSCMPRDAALAVAFTMTSCANTISQAHPQQYVISAHPRLCQLPAADIWSRLPHRTTRPIHSCSPVHGRTYALASVIATIAQTNAYRSTKDSPATTATSSTHTGSSRSRSSRPTNMTTSCTSSRSPASRRS